MKIWQRAITEVLIGTVVALVGIAALRYVSGWQTQSWTEIFMQLAAGGVAYVIARYFFLKRDHDAAS